MLAKLLTTVKPRKGLGSPNAFRLATNQGACILSSMFAMFSNQKSTTWHASNNNVYP